MWSVTKKSESLSENLIFKTRLRLTSTKNKKKELD